MQNSQAATFCLWVELRLRSLILLSTKCICKTAQLFVSCCKWKSNFEWVGEWSQKINGNFSSCYPCLQTRSQLIKAGVKLLIQSKRKNSGSSSCDADYRPPPPKIRATSVSSPVFLNNVIPPEAPSSMSSLKEELSLDSFQIKTDSTSSCDEDSETKFSAGKHEVIKIN